jgi:hypothetical protein
MPKSYKISFRQKIHPMKIQCLTVFVRETGKDWRERYVIEVKPGSLSLRKQLFISPMKTHQPINSNERGVYAFSPLDYRLADSFNTNDSGACGAGVGAEPAGY